MLIAKAAEYNKDYFRQKRNVAKEFGFSAWQKITTAMCIITYGFLANYVDEYIQIGGDIFINYVKKIKDILIKVFRVEYCT